MNWEYEGNEWRAEFGGRRWWIFKTGTFKYKLWCHDISSSWHHTKRAAKRQALLDAIEYAMFALDGIDDRFGELENTTAPEAGAGEQ
jgi:hypothetical protein